MKDKATLLFLAVIAYAAVAACLFQLTPLASPGARVSLQSPANPAPAIVPAPARQAYRHHHPRLPDHHEPATNAAARAVF